MVEAAAAAAVRARADLILVACARTKLKKTTAARDLYVSPLFRKSRAYAEAAGVPWFILSAEHGLVTPEQPLAPYDRYLPDTPPGYQQAWGHWVVERLALLAGPLDGRVVEVHAEAAYLDPITPHLIAKQARIAEPLIGLRSGERLAWYGDEPLPVGGPFDASSFVAALLNSAVAVTPDEFLAARDDALKTPGLYSWWVDQPGAQDLTRGSEQPIGPGLIYAGLAGATRWPSGSPSTNTLWSRIAGMHLGGNHHFSTFRRTLGSILAIGDRIDEAALTAWMREHLRVVAVPYPDADTLGRVEALVLGEIDPPLNLQGMAKTPLRTRISQLRKRYA